MITMRTQARAIQINSKHVVLMQSIIDNWTRIGRKCKVSRTPLLDGFGFPNDNEIVIMVIIVIGAKDNILHLVLNLDWVYMTKPETMYKLVDKVADLINESE